MDTRVPPPSALGSEIVTGGKNNNLAAVWGWETEGRDTPRKRIASRQELRRRWRNLSTGPKAPVQRGRRQAKETGGLYPVKQNGFVTKGNRESQKVDGLIKKWAWTVTKRKVFCY